jgi:hypothetical protein
VPAGTVMCVMCVVAIDVQLLSRFAVVARAAAW